MDTVTFGKKNYSYNTTKNTNVGCSCSKPKHNICTCSYVYHILHTFVYVGEQKDFPIVKALTMAS